MQYRIGQQDRLVEIVTQYIKDREELRVDDFLHPKLARGRADRGGRVIPVCCTAMVDPTTFSRLENPWFPKCGTLHGNELELGASACEKERRS